MSSIRGSSLRIGGLNSGLDTEAIVNAMTASTKLRITTNQRKVLRLEAQQDAYRSIIDKFNAFRDKYFDSLNGDTWLRSRSTFNRHSATLSRAGINQNLAGVTVSTNSRAVAGTYDVTVNSHASQAKITSKTTDSVTSSSFTPASFVNSATPAYTNFETDLSAAEKIAAFRKAGVAGVESVPLTAADRVAVMVAEGHTTFNGNAITAANVDAAIAALAGNAADAVADALADRLDDKIQDFRDANVADTNAALQAALDDKNIRTFSISVTVGSQTRQIVFRGGDNAQEVIDNLNEALARPPAQGGFGTTNTGEGLVFFNTDSNLGPVDTIVSRQREPIATSIVTELKDSFDLGTVASWGSGRNSITLVIDGHVRNITFETASPDFFDGIRFEWNAHNSSWNIVGGTAEARTAFNEIIMDIYDEERQEAFESLARKDEYAVSSVGQIALTRTERVAALQAAGFSFAGLTTDAQIDRRIDELTANANTNVAERNAARNALTNALNAKTLEKRIEGLESAGYILLPEHKASAAALNTFMNSLEARVQGLVLGGFDAAMTAANVNRTDATSVNNFINSVDRRADALLAAGFDLTPADRANATALNNFINRTPGAADVANAAADAANGAREAANAGTLDYILNTQMTATQKAIFEEEVARRNAATRQTEYERALSAAYENFDRWQREAIGTSINNPNYLFRDEWMLMMGLSATVPNNANWVDNLHTGTGGLINTSPHLPYFTDSDIMTQARQDSWAKFVSDTQRAFNTAEATAQRGQIDEFSFLQIGYNERTAFFNSYSDGTASTGTDSRSFNEFMQTEVIGIGATSVTLDAAEKFNALSPEMRARYGITTDAQADNFTAGLSLGGQGLVRFNAELTKLRTEQFDAAGGLSVEERVRALQGTNLNLTGLDATNHATIDAFIAGLSLANRTTANNAINAARNARIAQVTLTPAQMDDALTESRIDTTGITDRAAFIRGLNANASDRSRYNDALQAQRTAIVDAGNGTTTVDGLTTIERIAALQSAGVVGPAGIPGGTHSDITTFISTLSASDQNKANAALSRARENKINSTVLNDTQRQAAMTAAGLNNDYETALNASQKIAALNAAGITHSLTATSTETEVNDFIDTLTGEDEARAITHLTNAMVNGINNSADKQRANSSVNEALRQKIQTTGNATGNTKTITPTDIVNRFNNAAINNILDNITFGNGTRVKAEVDSAGRIEFTASALNGDPVRMGVIANDAATAQRLGLPAEQTAETTTSTVGRTTRLDQLGLTPGANGRYSFQINGVNFSFEGSTSISAMMTTVNSNAAAGVNMTFSTLTNTFEITAREFGRDVDIKINDGGQGLLARLGFDFDAAGVQSASQFTAGQNMSLTINNETIETTSDSYEVNGLTIKIGPNAVTGADGSFQVVVERDTSAMFDMIKDFMKDYNDLIDYVFGYMDQKPDPEYFFLTDTDREELNLSETQERRWMDRAMRGLLHNDRTISGIMSNMRTSMFSGIDRGDGTMFGLFSMGISTSSNWRDNGKLVFSTNGEARLRDAIENDIDLITELFTNLENGIMPKLQGVIDSATKTTGERSERGLLVQRAGMANQSSATSNAIHDQIKRLNDVIANLELRHQRQQDRFWRIFSAMEVQMGQLNSQTDFISQMGMQNMWGNNR